jgi:hypothetical protein
MSEEEKKNYVKLKFVLDFNPIALIINCFYKIYQWIFKSSK